MNIFLEGTYTNSLGKYKILFLKLPCCKGGIFLQLTPYMSQSPVTNVKLPSLNMSMSRSKEALIKNEVAHCHRLHSSLIIYFLGV